MNYDILTFKDFVQVQADLNHLRHKLKSPMADEERVQLFNQISDKTKEVMHHLNILHQGALGEEVEMSEDLRKWFKQKWVRMDTKGNIKGDCAREPGEGKPKCLPQAKAHSIGKEARATAARRKRREDPNPEHRGAPINVKTESVFEACWQGYVARGMKKKGNRMVPNCVPEETDLKDRFKKYIKPTVKTTSKIEKISNPAGRTTDHVEYKVTEPTGMVQRFKSKREAQAHYDSLKEDGVVVAAPTNVVGRGDIAGTGGLGGEPGVNLKKKKTPVLMSIRRKPIKA